MRADLAAHLHGLLVADRFHALLAQAVERRRVLAQVELGADQDDGHVGRMVLDLGEPLGLDVVEGRGRDDAEADEEDVGLRVGERAQAVVVLLAGRVPQPERDGLAVDHDAGGVVVEAERDVNLMYTEGFMRRPVERVGRKVVSCEAALKC